MIDCFFVALMIRCDYSWREKCCLFVVVAAVVASNRLMYNSKITRLRDSLQNSRSANFNWLVLKNKCLQYEYSLYRYVYKLFFWHVVYNQGTILLVRRVYCSLHPRWNITRATLLLADFNTAGGFFSTL